MTEYPAFPKIPRLHRDVVITEKIDGTNALVSIEELITDADRTDAPKVLHYAAHDGVSTVWAGNQILSVRAGSRKRWITPHDDNYGFARWVYDNAAELAKLGPGRHYGEWYGQGIQRGYGLTERRFALFNVSRWGDHVGGGRAFRPDCCDVVPLMATTTADRLNKAVDDSLYWLKEDGSVLVPGFMRPEGIIVYHTASGHLYKVLIENDDQPKGKVA